MPTLYTYVMPYDGGSAPNPYWGICTLVICKPKIRLSAQVGDWVVGTGSTRARVTDREFRDMSGRVVYAMRVTDKMTMQEYDALTRERLPNKIPDWFNRDWRRRVGDSIYDFTTIPPKQRKSVHDVRAVERDLGGGYALLSTDFYYFGDQAVALAGDLLPILAKTQGHRSNVNGPYLDRFVAWIRGLGCESGTVAGEPIYRRFRVGRQQENAARGEPSRGASRASCGTS